MDYRTLSIGYKQVTYIRNLLICEGLSTTILSTKHIFLNDGRGHGKKTLSMVEKETKSLDCRNF